MLDNPYNPPYSSPALRASRHDAIHLDRIETATTHGAAFYAGRRVVKQRIGWQGVRYSTSRFTR